MTSIPNRILGSLFGINVVKLKRLQNLRLEREALRSEMDSLCSEMDSLRSEMDSLLPRRDNLKFLPNTTFVSDRVEMIGSLLKIRSVPNLQKIRIGGPDDGGYVYLDDLNCAVGALSIGIGPDVSWDVTIADRGIRVYQYDHTVDAPPSLHENFVFHRCKLSSRDAVGEVTLASILSKYNMLTPASVIGKIDIEGDEWDTLSSAAPEVLSTFSQIACEFHWFEKVTDECFFDKVITTLSNLAKVFEPIHVHANNYSPLLVVGNKLFPSVLEITFANKTKYSFSDNREIFPSLLDAPNDPKMPDYPLGYFRY